MKSKSRIEKQLKKKTNPELVETIILAKKNPEWFEIASILSSSTRKQTNVNLDKINKFAKAGEIIVIPGKVLSLGEIDKKMKVVGFSFSEKAKEKLKKAGCEVILLKDEILKNKEAKGVKIIK